MYKLECTSENVQMGQYKWESSGCDQCTSVVKALTAVEVQVESLLQRPAIDTVPPGVRQMAGSIPLRPPTSHQKLNCTSGQHQGIQFVPQPPTFLPPSALFTPSKHSARYHQPSARFLLLLSSHPRGRAWAKDSLWRPSCCPKLT